MPSVITSYSIHYTKLYDEAAFAGVRLNTDAIDNSAGVNTSDLEVNIKIALPKPQPNAEWPQTGGLSHHDMEHLSIGAQIVADLGHRAAQLRQPLLLPQRPSQLRLHRLQRRLVV